MSKFNDFKKIIFSDTKAQEKLIKNMSEKGYDSTDFDDAFEKLIYQVKEVDLQTILAPFLREIAIQHLENGETEYVSEFRKRYNEVIGKVDVTEPGDEPDIENFFTEQKKPYIYATDIAAGALAEKIGVTFACTQVDTNNLAISRPYIYYHSNNENTPIIHLYNRPNDHFFIIDGDYTSTFGDGNCLYNGFAQLIRQFCLIENHKCYPNIKFKEKKIKPIDIKNSQAVKVNDIVEKLKQRPKKINQPDASIYYKIFTSLYFKIFMLILIIATSFILTAFLFKSNISPSIIAKGINHLPKAYQAIFATSISIGAAATIGLSGAVIVSNKLCFFNDYESDNNKIPNNSIYSIGK